MTHPAQADDAKGMTPRLLQDETQTYGSKGLSRWLSSRLSARRDAREASRAIYEAGGGDAARDALLRKCDEISDQQVRDQDSLFGCLPEEPKS